MRECGRGGEPVIVVERLERQAGLLIAGRLAAEEFLEICERRMGRGDAGLAFACITRVAGRFQSPLVLVVVAVDAQQLPVAAIGWIVVVIVVAVMDRQLAQVGPCEFTAATTADPRNSRQARTTTSMLSTIARASSLSSSNASHWEKRS